MGLSTQLPHHQRLLLDRVVRQAGLDGLDEFVDAHPLLRDPALIEALCDEAVKLTQIDVRQAEKLVLVACDLAKASGSAALEGRSLRSHGTVLCVLGNNEAALELYEKALEVFSSADQQIEAGITLTSALQTLAYLGQHDRSLEWAAEARRIFENAGDNHLLARLEANMGAITYRYERFEEALELTESAYERLLAVGEPSEVAVCLRNLVTMHISLRNFQEAEDVSAQARRYCEEANLPRLAGEVEYNIAYLYYLRGDYPAAIDLYRSTRERCEAVGEPYHLALCDLDEAEIYLEINLIPEALRTTESAIRRFGRLGMLYEQAKAMCYLSIARIRQGKTILGLDIFDKARALFETERNEVWLGFVDLHKAIALAREGRRFEAERLARDAKNTFEASGLRPRVAACDALLADLRLADSDPTAARRFCNQAVARLADIGLPSLERDALCILGRVEEASGDRRSALSAYEGAHHKLISDRGRASVEEIKIPLVGNRLEAYDALVTLLHEEDNPQNDPLIFDYIEAAKGRSIADLLAFPGTAPPPRRARSVQVERVRRLREELNWYYQNIDLKEMTQDEPSPESVAELRREVHGTEEALAETLREVGASDPEFAALNSTETVRIADLQRSLAPGAVFLEFYTARDTLYVCAIDATRIDVRPVSLASRVLELFRGFGDQLFKFRLGEPHVTQYGESILQTSRDILHELYLELLEPLEDRISGAESLTIVPHSYLHWLPFHALYDGEAYLADRCPISYALSATTFQRCVNRAPLHVQRSLLLATSEEAHDEVERLAGEFSESRILMGPEASVKALREYGATSLLTHLATTAEFRSDNPMFSTLEFSDDRMSLFDLFGLQLDTELAVVSGSGARVEAATEGEEFVGLARGLLYAGCRSALLPLWDPPSEIRVDLLETFYRELHRGTSRTEALNRAMLEVRRVHEHPFYWAWPALVGAPGPIEALGIESRGD